MSREVAVELEDYGIPGPSHIRSVLGKTRKANTLVNAIKKFQNDNGIKNSALVPALKLLDVHSIKRTDVYEQMIGSVSESLLGKIRCLGEEGSELSRTKLKEQLKKSFQMYRIPHIRPIVLETLNQLSHVDDSYVEQIVSDPKLYADLSIRVKRRVWLKHEHLFVEAVEPVIAEYIASKRFRTN